MRTPIAVIVSLLLLSTTSVAVGSSSITKIRGTYAPKVVSLTSLKVSTTAFLSRHKRSGKELCKSRRCKRREWLKHHPRPRYIPATRLYQLESTAYCLSGSTSTAGVSAGEGVVAVPQSWPLGKYFQIRSGVLKGKVLYGADHIGSGSEFDIWMPTCDQANVYGRRGIQVAEISPNKAKAALAHHT
jgi:3D (Asp-Asp-Asp) domain-containing protein